MTPVRRLAGGEKWILPLALLVGLFHGIVYTFIVPLWQHYDEPQHFEYAWMLAQQGRRPMVGDADFDLRRNVAKSMVDSGFFDHQGFRPDLKSTSQPAWIGPASQLYNPPLYYYLPAIPLRLLHGVSVGTLLLAARLANLPLFLLTLLAAWGVARELTRPGQPLRLILPLGLALLPGLANLMSSVNSDAGAVALVSLGLWAALRLVRRGIAWLPLLSLCLLGVLSWWTKETAYILYPLALLALLFTVFRGRQRWLAWTLLGLGLLGGAAGLLKWDDAAGWYRSTAQAEPTRTRSSLAIAGEYVFQLNLQAPTTPGWVAPLFQPLPQLTGKNQPAAAYTLGVWMWSSEPTQAVLPVVGTSSQTFIHEVRLTTESEFFAYTFTLDGSGYRHAWVNIDPPAPTSEQAAVYLDGLILAEGSFPLDEKPIFESSAAQSGVWAGQQFTNLLRNASAERAGIRLRPWADTLGARILPDGTRPSLVLTYLMDSEGAFWFQRANALRLFRTFWGQFGWGQVPLLGSKPYRAIFIWSIIGLLGAVLWLAGRFTSRKAVLWAEITLLGFLAFGLWGLAFVRTPIYMSVPPLYQPVARYVYPAVIATVLPLSMGWWLLLDWLVKLLRRWLAPARQRLLMIAVFFAGSAGFALYAIVSILRSYGNN